MRRILVAVAVAIGILLVSAGPALADNDLSVTVAGVTPDQVRLDAEIPRVSGGGLPPVTVSREGWLLASTVAVAPPGPSADRTVIVVVDTGGKMAGAPLRAARDGVLAFAAAVPADVAIGLVTAADEPSVALRPTRDRAALGMAVARMRAGGDASIYAGLRAAANLGSEATDRRFVLVTSGRGDGGDAGPVVDQLSTAGERVDLVSFGELPAGLGQLQDLVAATGGTVRSAASTDALSAVLRAAAVTIPLRVTITVAVPPDLAGEAGTLRVTAGKGASSARADVDVQFASPQAVSSPTGGARRLLPSLVTSETWLLAGLVFGTLLVSMLLALSGLGGSVRRRRLRQVEQFRMAARGYRSSGPGIPVPAEGGFSQT
ncbi:MAG TPA: vWA domain-containing protein, partial [Micromonosporaceae bacterium]